MSLLINAVWLSPIYPSPMADFGYDISNYTDIDPIFGTMQDFDRLLEEVKRRDLKLMLDYVPNHTSSQHPNCCSKPTGIAGTGSGASIICFNEATLILMAASDPAPHTDSF
jgi:hypothetical protein